MYNNNFFLQMNSSPSFSDMSVDLSTSVEKSNTSINKDLVPYINLNVKHRLTKDSVVDAINTNKRRVTSEYFVNKEIDKLVSGYVVIYYIKCDGCKAYSPIDSKEIKVNQFCKCKRKLHVKENNFFVYIPLLQQIIKTICHKIESIIQPEPQNGNIRDNYDGEFFKKWQNNLQFNKFLLPLTFNTDGVQVFKSNKLSLWPLQVYQDYLPPNRRYLPENILVIGLWYGRPSEMDFFEFMRPMVEELNLLRNGIDIEIGDKYKCFPYIRCITVDMPAKAKIQGILQGNGKESCTAERREKQ